MKGSIKIRFLLINNQIRHSSLALFSTDLYRINQILLLQKSSAKETLQLKIKVKMLFFHKSICLS
jgi:hypothetical protein